MQQEYIKESDKKEKKNTFTTKESRNKYICILHVLDLAHICLHNLNNVCYWFEKPVPKNYNKLLCVLYHHLLFELDFN